MPGIERGNDAVHAHRAAVDRDLDHLRAIAAAGFVDGDAAKYAFRQRTEPIGLFGRGVEHGDAFGISAQEPPPVEIWINSGGVRHLVDETLLVKGVLRVVDRAPYADRHRRLSDDVVDQIVRHVVRHFLGHAAEERAVDECACRSRPRTPQRMTGRRAVSATRSACLRHRDRRRAAPCRTAGRNRGGCPPRASTPA